MPYSEKFQCFYIFPEDNKYTDYNIRRRERNWYVSGSRWNDRRRKKNL